MEIMDKDIEKLETEILDRAKSSLQENIEYLLSMEREFDKDTRALYELLREKTDYVLADCKDPEKFEEFQLYARAFTRAAYAHIEGASHLMRLMVLWAHDRGELHLSELSMRSYQKNIVERLLR